jgi:hypothetical protein
LVQDQGQFHDLPIETVRGGQVSGVEEGDLLVQGWAGQDGSGQGIGHWDEPLLWWVGIEKYSLFHTRFFLTTEDTEYTERVRIISVYLVSSVVVMRHRER